MHIVIAMVLACVRLIRNAISLPTGLAALPQIATYCTTSLNLRSAGVIIARRASNNNSGIYVEFVHIPDMQFGQVLPRVENHGNVHANSAIDIMSIYLRHSSSNETKYLS